MFERLAESAKTAKNRLEDALYAPVGIIPLACFRIAFGGMMLWEMLRLLASNRIPGRIEQPFHFTYFGFDWVRPLPADGMTALFVVLAICAFFVMIGFAYRAASTVLFLGFTFAFLAERANYLNHTYLFCIVALKMALSPAHRALSLTVLLRPATKAVTVAHWHLALLRFQMIIAYAFAGIAKVNGDWLHGYPMRLWLPGKGDMPVIGPLLAHGLAPFFFSYGGLLFDLFIVPLLYWKRSRPLAYALLLVFHGLNALIFPGTELFPWFMLITAPILFPLPESWARRLPLALRGPDRVDGPRTRPRLAVTCFVMAYAAVQLVLPMRHFFYPDNVNWTGEGSLFAWRMLQAEKYHVSYAITVREKKTGREGNVRLNGLLSPFQRDTMLTKPDMLLQFAHFFAEQARKDGTEISVFARIYVTMNGREPQLLVDPEVDLAAQPRDLRHARWIMPLTSPPPYVRRLDGTNPQKLP
jgi:vitamin K-dependent gamma-carboxylase